MHEPEPLSAESVYTCASFPLPQEYSTAWVRKEAAMSEQLVVEMGLGRMGSVGGHEDG